MPGKDPSERNKIVSCANELRTEARKRGDKGRIISDSYHVRIIAYTTEQIKEAEDFLGLLTGFTKIGNREWISIKKVKILIN